MDLGDGPMFVGASVGLAFFPDDANDVETLHKRADLAMYEAKQSGRGQCRRFSAEMDGRAKLRLELSTQIDLALQNEDFEVHYQPILELASGMITGAEALVRWPQPDGTYIAPSTFIPHAEEVGLVKRIDQWVLERACTDASRWQKRFGRPLDVSVNLSAISLQQPDLPQQLASILERTGLAPGNLRIEITETVVIANPQLASQVLHTIAATGVRLSLDDFGTGYSSLNYLVQFPIHRIKLDCSFVDRIGKDSANEEIIRSLLDLAARLRIGVVAEGVEDQRQMDFLVAAGCGFIQGFYVARGMPLEEFMRTAQSRRFPALAMTACAAA
jgi:EAL domain-containing protein (putative c-di-GMP-specific phosphodiesterase class I)